MSHHHAIARVPGSPYIPATKCPNYGTSSRHLRSSAVHELPLSRKWAVACDPQFAVEHLSWKKSWNKTFAVKKDIGSPESKEQDADITVDGEERGIDSRKIVRLHQPMFVNQQHSYRAHTP